MVACVEGMLTLRARAAAAATTGQYNKIAGIAIYDRASPLSLGGADGVPFTPAVATPRGLGLGGRLPATAAAVHHLPLSTISSENRVNVVKQFASRCELPRVHTLGLGRRRAHVRRAPDPAQPLAAAPDS